MDKEKNLIGVPLNPTKEEIFIGKPHYSEIEDFQNTKRKAEILLIGMENSMGKKIHTKINEIAIATNNVFPLGFNRSFQLKNTYKQPKIISEVELKRELIKKDGKIFSGEAKFISKYQDLSDLKAQIKKHKETCAKNRGKKKKKKKNKY
jgi:hypothetical protein